MVVNAVVVDVVVKHLVLVVIDIMDVIARVRSCCMPLVTHHQHCKHWIMPVWGFVS